MNSKIINDNFLHHASFLQSLTNGMMTVKEEGFCYSDSGISSDTFNILYITDGNNFNPSAFQKAIDHYQTKQFEYCIWVNEENLSPKVIDALQDAGLQEAGNDPGMLIDLKNYNATPTNGDIRKLSTLEDFADLVSRNWTPPDQNVIEFYKRVTPPANIEYFGSYVADKPVCVIELFPDTNTNAGLYSLCTLAEHRGKGIATNLMKYCLAHLRSKGYTTATLQASDDGLRIYQRLGFEQATRFSEFKPTTHSAGTNHRTYSQ